MFQRRRCLRVVAVGGSSECEVQQRQGGLRPVHAIRPRVGLRGLGGYVGLVGAALPLPFQEIIDDARHAAFVAALAVCGGSIERAATEVRNLQHTEIGEVQEPFAAGQKGSSAMPHKKNPVLLERITGLSRVLRGYAVTALENVALWDERDISHSGAERVILPDSCIALDYMMAKLTGVIEKLEIRADRMERNIYLTKGLIFSQRVLLALTAAGMNRETAYAVVQRNALRCWQDGTPLQDALLSDREVRGVLAPVQINALFTLEPYMAHVDSIFARVGLSSPTEKPKPEPKPARGRGRRTKLTTPPALTEGGAVHLPFMPRFGSTERTPPRALISSTVLCRSSTFRQKCENPAGCSSLFGGSSCGTPL